MTDVRLTQQLVEEWASTNPSAQTTQVSLEMWASVQTVSGQVVVSQMLIEQWASVDVPVVPAGQDVRVMVLA
jgi:hypothetical protein